MKRFLMCFVLLSVMTSILSIDAKGQTDKYENDIVGLKNLTDKYTGKSTENKYLIKIFDLAKSKNDTYNQAWAASNIIRNLYNRNLWDSVSVWADTLEYVTKGMDKHPYEYYFGMALSYRLRIWRSDGQAAAKAMRLYQMAVAERSNIGQAICCETIGVIYRLFGQDSIACIFFFDGVKRVEAEKPLNASRLSQLLSMSIESSLNCSNYSKVPSLILKYEKLTHDIANKVYDVPKFSVERSECLAVIFNIRYYTEVGKLDVAKSYVEKGKAYLNANMDHYVLAQLHSALAVYFMKTKDNVKALDEINHAIAGNPEPANYYRRVEIYRRLGRYDKACEDLESLLRGDKLLRSKNYMRQASNLASLYTKSNVAQTKEKIALDSKKTQFVIFISLLFFLVLVIIFLYLSIRKQKKIRREMLIDRNKLLISEQALREEKNRTQESDRLKSLFLANMSHEIRTPLNAIVGFSSIITDKDALSMTSEELQEYRDLIETNTDALLRLVSDVLDVSELEAEGTTFNFEECDLTNVCAMLAANIQCFVEEGVEVTFHPASDKYMLRTDQARLEQVIMNLLHNSAKFTKKGTIDLSFTVDEEKGYVTFAVQDTGCGIPKDKQATIFDRFVKVDDYVPGTGLGLSICSLVVKQFAGKIWVDQNYNEGARFVFTHRIGL